MLNKLNRDSKNFFGCKQSKICVSIAARDGVGKGKTHIELAKSIPRRKFTERIVANKKRSKEFTQFYAALLSTQLRPMVDAVKSKNAEAALKMLHKHDVDDQALVRIVYTVISF